MKKFLGLLVLILLLNGCDDGDVTVEAIRFDDTTASSCGEIIYKVKGNQALFMKIPAALNAFANEITPANTPRVIPIGTNVIVRYRSYTGPVTANSICPDVVQPISPIATIEWVAVSGNIEITTTPVYTAPDAATGATRLVKYNHNIAFRNITFAKPGGQQRYDTFSFGDYATNATSLPLSFLPENVRICSFGTTVYNAANGGIEAMYIYNLDQALLSTSVLNVAKKGLIGTTANNLTYRLLASALATGTNDDYFCTGAVTTPFALEEWIADPGVANVSGTIEVVTTTNGPNAFLHTIRLKAVTFRKGNVAFYYGNDILFGELITTN